MRSLKNPRACPGSIKIGLSQFEKFKISTVPH